MLVRTIILGFSHRQRQIFLSILWSGRKTVFLAGCLTSGRIKRGGGQNGWGAAHIHLNNLRPYMQNLAKYEAARALRNARLIAQAANDEDWGQTATNPHSPTGNGRFGYPIVWLKDYAVVYSPEADQKKKQIFRFVI